MLKLPDGTVKVLVEGAARVSIENIRDNAFLSAEVSPIISESVSASENEALVRTLGSEFENYGKLSKKVPAEILKTLSGISDVVRLVDTIAAHLELKVQKSRSCWKLPLCQKGSMR